MTSPWQYALTVGPLGVYLWVLGNWQGDRRPRVVRGLADFSLLAFGVGGVLIFGPVGETLTRMLSPRPDLYDRVAVAAGLGLLACLLARRALKRLVVYQVEADRLHTALADVLKRADGCFVRTLGGFEDASASRGLRVELTPWLRCAVVEAFGSDAEGLIQFLRPRLAERLALTGGPGSKPLALFICACSILVSVVPIVGHFLTQPRAREALRVLIRHLEGG